LSDHNHYDALAEYEEDDEPLSKSMENGQEMECYHVDQQSQSGQEGWGDDLHGLFEEEDAHKDDNAVIEEEHH